MLENLEALSITNLKNVKIPKAIKTLPKLTYLDCFRCGFERIPNNMLNKNIKCIGINCDTVEQVAQICQIGKLEELYLSGSKIEELPREVGDLKFLKTLWLVNSKIEIIPDSLPNLRQIGRFDISGTSLEIKIPEEIRKQTAYELISYICKQQNQQKDFFFNESKMIIVGQGNVGIHSSICADVKGCILKVVQMYYKQKTIRSVVVIVGSFIWTIIGGGYKYLQYKTFLDSQKRWLFLKRRFPGRWKA